MFRHPTRYDVLVNGLRLQATAATLDEEDLRELSALLAPRTKVTKPDAPEPKPLSKKKK